MPPTPKLLLVGPDPVLRAEVEDALQGLTGASPVLHHAADFLQGIVAIRSHRPDFVIVEMGKDLRRLKSFTKERDAVSPETVVAAAFSPALFGRDASESDYLIEALRAGVQDFLRRPLSRLDLEQYLSRLSPRVKSPPALLGRVVAFLGSKGGVGKSTLAVNSACGLALEHPDRVLLLDASLQMGACASLLDIQPQTSLSDAVGERDRLDETLLRRLAARHPCGLHLLAAPANAVEAAAVDGDVLAHVLTLARRTYDYVLVDTFALLDQVVLAILDVSDRIYLVIEGTVPAVRSAVGLLRLLDNLGLPGERRRIVLNRYTGGIDNLNANDIARRLERDVDHVIPSQRKLSVAANTGQPYLLDASRWWGCGRALHGLVQDIEAVPPSYGPGGRHDWGHPPAPACEEVVTDDA